MDQQKLSILLDKNVNWDANKASILDEITACTLGSDPTKVKTYKSRSTTATQYYNP